MARSTSKNRKEEILEAGLEVFAKRGYYNTTTAHIAEKAGISQPYVFRFYRTKEELFIAVLGRAFERIIQTIDNVQANSEELGIKIVEAYEELMVSHPNEVALQVIGISITEEAIQNVTKSGLVQMRNKILERFKQAGIENAERNATVSIAMGMMCNITYFLDLPEFFDSFQK
ncbi:TetR/AcrR family transcriptional regulator [Alkalihalobacillus sp. 1P02AB]|uniref:TetR/AcrR family transcriptional regulator n=1 Tax=Alkalihalobacillus sp. 1P02AB TaxID=3132260 RepID=UPI0039A6DFFC